MLVCSSIFFFFNDTATTEIYTLSLHDALPICCVAGRSAAPRSSRSPADRSPADLPRRPRFRADRKSTRLNSSHSQISYAVFCLKKKTQITPLEDAVWLLATCHRATLDIRRTTC